VEFLLPFDDEIFPTKLVLDINSFKPDDLRSFDCGGGGGDVERRLLKSVFDDV